MYETIIELVKSYEIHRNPQAASAMAAYMRNQFPLLGIKTPLRREILKEFLQTHSANKNWVPLI